jgi:UDP-glucose 4-epimerase
MTEMLAGCHDLDYVIIRPHNVYGPGQALSDIHRNVLGIWMNKIMLGQPVTIYGDGQQVRAMSYIEDSLPAYIKAGLEPMNHQRIFNIGGDDPKSILELALVTIAAMGQDPNIYPLDYIDPRHKEVHNAYCSHLLAKQVFNFSNKTSLKDGIQAMADWAMKKGPQKWNTVDKLEITNHLTPQMWINGGQP